MKKHLLLALSAIVLVFTSCEKGTTSDPIEDPKSDSNILYTEVTINFDHEYEWVVEGTFGGENWVASTMDSFTIITESVSTTTFNFPVRFSYYGNPISAEKSYLRVHGNDTYWDYLYVSDIKDYSKVTLHAPDGGGELIITDGVKR